MKKKYFDINDKIVIVTGGARGNGLSIAKGLFDNGAKVVLVDINKQLLNKAYENFNDINAIKILADINRPSDRKKIIDQTLKNFSKIDCLINNSGISISNSSEKYKSGDWEKTISTNLSSIFYLTQEVAKKMIKNKIEGSIINITSLGSSFGMPNNPAYVASKGGLKYLSKAMALDWGKYNIRVNNISPGYIQTTMTKKSFDNKKTRLDRSHRTMLNRWGKPEDLVGAAIFLISSESSYITGSDLIIDGGWTAKGL